jgi:hypothetical protein
LHLALNAYGYHLVASNSFNQFPDHTKVSKCISFVHYVDDDDLIFIVYNIQCGISHGKEMTCKY